jgi:hypothetical protein
MHEGRKHNLIKVCFMLSSSRIQKRVETVCKLLNGIALDIDKYDIIRAIELIFENKQHIGNAKRISWSSKESYCFKFEDDYLLIGKQELDDETEYGENIIKSLELFGFKRYINDN